jgi:membrane protein YdbS with pleckstrin-like domain
MNDQTPQMVPVDPARQYNQGLTPLHPQQKTLMRLNSVLTWVPLIIVAMIADLAIQTQLPGELLAYTPWTILGVIVVLALFFILALPGRRYRRWGYDLGDEQLRVLRGFLWRTDTIVPFNRIQHIDVAQGPLLRLFDLSTLIVHTAGTHNSIVSLPGLATVDAEAMRETIKGHIRQDMI